MRTRSILLSVFLLLLASACGGDDDGGGATASGSGSGSASEPADEDDEREGGDEVDDVPVVEDTSECPILKSEIEAIVGFEVSELRPESGGGNIGCIVDFAEGTGSIAVRIYEDEGEAAHEAFMAAFEDAEELEVLGREAVWAPGVGVLDIIDGDDGIQIQVNEAMNDDIPDERQTAIDLAGIVLASR
jgi:hypothetical protein